MWRGFALNMYRYTYEANLASSRSFDFSNHFYFSSAHWCSGMAKATAKDDLKLLFERPTEPLFTKKDNGKVAFDVPQDYFTDRYKPIGVALSNRQDDGIERTVHLRDISKPNLDFAKKIKIRGPFSLFNRKHQEVAGQLTNIFLDAPDVETLLSTAAFVKDRVNPYLFQVSATFSFA